MRKSLLVTVLSFFLFLGFSKELSAQCSVCTKTAEQMGEQPAKGMNSGIIYLAITPLALIGFLVFRWKKDNAEKDA